MCQRGGQSNALAKRPLDVYVTWFQIIKKAQSCSQLFMLDPFLPGSLGMRLCYSCTPIVLFKKPLGYLHSCVCGKQHCTCKIKEQSKVSGMKCSDASLRSFTEKRRRVNKQTSSSKVWSLVVRSDRIFRAIVRGCQHTWAYLNLAEAALRGHSTWHNPVSGDNHWVLGVSILWPACLHCRLQVDYKSSLWAKISTNLKSLGFLPWGALVCSLACIEYHGSTSKVQIMQVLAKTCPCNIPYQDGGSVQVRLFWSSTRDCQSVFAQLLVPTQQHSSIDTPVNMSCTLSYKVACEILKRGGTSVS